MSFGALVHADWSAGPAGRWMATAHREAGGWRAGEPRLVPPLPEFIDALFAMARQHRVVAGFDFPIGVPVTYGRRLGYSGFPEAIGRLGDWLDEVAVADEPAAIGLRRPFYPARPGAARQAHLLDGHGVAAIDDLMRRCERGGPDRRAAGSLFWTLGANQVGKAALAGWRGVVAPAQARGAALWPFSGPLGAMRAPLTLVETYPADVYTTLGAAFGPGESKLRREDRARKGPAMLAWAEAAGLAVSHGLRAALLDGFGAEDRGGDRFDAVVGLFGLVATIEGLRPEGVPDDPAVLTWEGWILGRPA